MDLATFLSDAVRPDAVLRSNQVASLDAGMDSRNTEAGIAVRPRTRDEVSGVLRACNARGISVVTHGGRTGLAGAAISHPGEVILLTDHLKTDSGGRVVNGVDGDKYLGAAGTVCTIDNRITEPIGSIHIQVRLINQNISILGDSAVIGLGKTLDAKRITIFITVIGKYINLQGDVFIGADNIIHSHGRIIGQIFHIYSKKQLITGGTGENSRYIRAIAIALFPRIIRDNRIDAIPI